MELKAILAIVLCIAVWGGRCFVMPEGKALFAHGKPLDDGVSGVFHFLSHVRVLLFPYLYIAKERMTSHALLCSRSYGVLIFYQFCQSVFIQPRYGKLHAKLKALAKSGNIALVSVTALIIL